MSSGTVRGKQVFAKYGSNKLIQLTWANATTEGRLWIGNNDSPTVLINGNSDSYINNGSNFGIGTATPNVSGYNSDHTVLTIDGQSGTDGYGTIELKRGGGTNGAADLGEISFLNQTYRAAAIRGRSEDTDSGQLNFLTKNDGVSETVKMVIQGDGNVGIGTTSPNQKLDVNGAVVISPNTDGKDTHHFTTNASNDGRYLIKSDTTTKVDIQANGSSYFTGGNVGVGTATPSVALDISATDAIKLPVGTTAQRPTAAEGLMRLNTTTDQFEGYNNGNWQGLGGVIDVDQDTYVSTEKTSDDDTLFFYTAGAERAKIDNAGNVHVANNLTVSGNLAVSGDFTLGDATTDKITTRGDLYVEDDAVFSDTVRVTGDAYFAGDVGIGTATPSVSLDIVGTDAIKLPAGTEAQRPSAAGGLLRLNTDDNRFEGHGANGWIPLGQGTGDLTSDVHTANGVLSGFALSMAPNDDKNVLVSVGGVVQTPTTNYVVNSSTLNFTSVPPSGVEIEARHLNVGFISYEDETIPGAKTFSDDVVMLGDLSVSGDFTLGDATTDKITTRGDLYVEDDAYFSGDIVINSTSEPQLTIKETDAGNDAVVLKANGSRGILTLFNNGSSDIVLNAQANLNSYINTGGNFGIGTTAPATKLHVYHNTTNEYAAIIDQDEPNAGHGLKVTSDGNGAGSNILEVESGSTSLFRVRGDGKVGIGTTTPRSLLELGSGGLHIDDNYGIANFFGGMYYNGSSMVRTAGGTRKAAGIYVNTGGHIQFITAPETSGTTATESIKFHIDNDGKVGIGTTAPSQLLSVNGTVGIKDATISYSSGQNRLEVDKDLKLERSTGTSIYMRRTTADTVSLLGKIEFGNNNIDSNVAVISAYQGGATDAGELRFETEATSGSLATRMTIKSDGKVGIGTAAPGYLLHLSDTIADIKVVSTTGTNRAGLQTTNTGGTSYFYRESNNGGAAFAGTSPYATVVGGTGAYPLQLGTNNAVRMTIASDGKVGIGTATPGSYWASADDLVIATTGNTGMTLVAGTTSSSSAIAFADGTGSSAYRGRIEYNHSTDKLMLGAGGTTPFAIKGDGNTSLPDNSKALFGTGDDLQIYHDGSNSYIKNQIGWINMPLSQNGLSIANADFSELIATFRVNGSCDLYYDGSKKLETNSGGVTVTGTAILGGASFVDNATAYFGTGNDLRIYHDGNHSVHETDAGTGSLRFWRASRLSRVNNAASK